MSQPRDAPATAQAGVTILSLPRDGPATAQVMGTILAQPRDAPATAQVGVTILAMCHKYMAILPYIVLFNDYDITVPTSFSILNIFIKYNNCTLTLMA